MFIWSLLARVRVTDSVQGDRDQLIKSLNNAVNRAQTTPTTAADASVKKISI